MWQDKTEIYKSFEISYSVYGENGKYSAMGAAWLLSRGGVCLKVNLSSPSGTLEGAEARLLEAIKKLVDEHLRSA